MTRPHPKTVAEHIEAGGPVCITCGRPLDLSGLNSRQRKAASVCASCVRAQPSASRNPSVPARVSLLTRLLDKLSRPR